jgi:zinc protease
MKPQHQLCVQSKHAPALAQHRAGDKKGLPMNRPSGFLTSLLGGTSFSLAAWVVASAGLASPVPTAAAQTASQNATAQPTFKDSDPLPTDPRLVTGEFANGMRYVVMQHAVPPGRAAVWLHVSSGSLNETEKQRGIAHFLEHMAFNGSANFPPGSVIDFFQGLGLTFGRHQNASTSFDRTNYRLEMPDNKPETVGKALTFLSDVAFKLTLPQDEIDKERGIILEEKRTRIGAQQRVQEAWLKRMAPGSIFGERIPIGTEATINSMMQQDFKDYYSSWYTPSNMAIFMVADLPAAEMVETLRAKFSEGTKAPKPKDQDVGVKPLDATRGVVITDAELTQATVAIMRLDPPAAPVTTYGRAREQLVEQLGSIAFNRRIERKIAKGQFSGLRGGMSAGSFANTMRIAQVQASGTPDKWEAMLKDAASELQRARTYGFAKREIDDALREILSRAESSLQTEATRGAVQILGSFDSAFASGETLTSAQQDLDILKAIAATMTKAQVDEAFRKGFDLAQVTFSLQVPSGANVPTDEQLAAAGKAALEQKVEEESVSEGANSLMAAAPAAASMGTPELHAATQVTTWSMPNGVKVHHRFNDYKKNSVAVSITLAGGELLETAKNRGITDAATQAWQRAATTTLASTDINDLMVGKKVNVAGFAQPDAIALSVSGTPDDLETGMQLAHLLLTAPNLEQAAFDQWRTGQLQAIESAKKSPARVLFKTLAGTVFPANEDRVLPLTAEQVNAVSRDAAQEWLGTLIAQSPIEVSIVGDISQAAAADIVGKYLATLPVRKAIDAKTYADRRALVRPAGARVVRETLDTETKQAQVVVGFYGVDVANTTDARVMSAAAQILSTRAIQRIREKENLAYSPRMSSNPSSAYPGFGMFMCGTSTDPAKADRLAEVIAEMYADFAKNGPSEDEVLTVRKQIANTLGEQMKEPTYWMGRTRALSYRGQNLDDIATEQSFFETLSGTTLKEVFSKYYAQDRLWTVIVTPK